MDGIKKNNNNGWSIKATILSSSSSSSFFLLFIACSRFSSSQSKYFLKIWNKNKNKNNKVIFAIFLSPFLCFVHKNKGSIYTQWPKNWPVNRLSIFKLLQILIHKFTGYYTQFALHVICTKIYRNRSFIYIQFSYNFLYIFVVVAFYFLSLCVIHILFSNKIFMKLLPMEQTSNNNSSEAKRKTLFFSSAAAASFFFYLIASLL